MKKLILSSILLILLSLLGLGILWNSAATRKDLANYPAEGILIDAFDTSLHLFTVGNGSAGQPEILLLSGLNTPSPTADFYPLWSQLKEEYRVTVLERPGYGWSQPTKRSRTVENIVEEYRFTLNQSGIKPPYVLAAHSISGIEAWYFAAAYPDEVAGVILLDCTPPQQILDYGPDAGKVSLLNRIMPILRKTGILRLISTISPDTIAKMSQEMRNDFIMVNDHYKNLDLTLAPILTQNPMVMNEQKNRYQNALAVSTLPFPDTIPLTLIIADKEEYHAYPEYQEQLDMLRSWATQAARGKSVLLNGGHYIHHYDPNGVCNEIRQIAGS